ncbi:flagellar hook protein FlgE [Aquisalimonas asiatica]|uniref:Flagellar hook protein FlgE n=1 Tax=Aquisalimonas asiatica TaxID=406100 RepID=A0A1H8UJI6_9GAMM|nr:flagellar hook protein FlgE [Aquisalimonas asiatica]SEP03400.1 flagellar hook protein FlgE [Aquisalimonas asiatica]
MSFNISLSGLNSASSDLDVTSNNIANSGTVGFKGSRAEFADVFAQTQFGIASNAIGSGSRLQNVAQQFTQGQFDFTGNNLDLAVNGEGFFRLQDNDGSVSYTRNGAFQLNQDGVVENADGRALTGYPADGDGNVGGTLQPLSIDTGNVPPQATTAIDIDANLQSNADGLDPTNFDVNDPETFNFSTSTTVYDGQGTSRSANIYFVKDEGEENEWLSVVEIGDQLIGIDDPDNPDPDEMFRVAFNSDGSFDSVVPGPGAGNDAQDTSASSIDFEYDPGDGLDPQRIEVDYGALTQFGTPSAVNELTQNGFEAGEFSSLDIEEDGTVFGRYTNGESLQLGRVATARFPSEQNLTEVGDNLWLESAESGEPILGQPTTSGLGGIQSGALEQSNVDITEQLVNMITAQRNFQANAQMISTQDQVTQEILNIR